MTNRIAYIDYFKAIAMIFVVMGHINFANEGIKVWIYSFHMPAFFFATGLVLRNDGSLGAKTKLNKYFRRLILPYILWALIYAKFSIPNLLLILYGSYSTISKSGALTSLWFLPVMFIAVMMFLMTCRLSAKYKLGIMAMLLLICPILPKLKGGYPWSVNVALCAFFFLLLANLLRPHIGKIYTLLMQRNRNTILFLSIMAVVSFISSLLYLQNNVPSGYVLMGNARYGNYLLFVITAVSGIIMLLSISMLLESFHTKTGRWLSFIGQNTLCIFAVQKPIIGCFGKAFSYISFPSEFVLLGTTIGTITISCLMCMIINRYVPVLAGK